MIGKIGQANYGLYNLSISFITLFVMDFGLSQAVTRFLSKYKAEQDKETAANFLGIIYKLYFSIDILIFIILIVLYFFIDIIYKNLTPSEIEIFKVLYIIVGLFTIIHFPFINLDGILTSNEKFIELKSMTLINRILTIVLIVICLLKGYGVYALVTVNAVVGILVILIKLIIIKKKTNTKINFRYWNTDMLKNTVSFSIWILIYQFFERFIFIITPTIIASFSKTGTVGVAIFSLAVVIEQYVHTFGLAINGIFVPRMSKILLLPNADLEINKLVIKVGRIQNIVISYLILLWICFGKYFIINIWHRGEFSLSYLCSVLIIIPNLFYLPLEISDSVFAVKNQVKYKAILYLGIAIINILLAIPLSKYYGALGCSISVFLALTFRAVGYIYMCQNKINLNMKEFCNKVFSKFILFLAIILILGLFIEKYNNITNNYIHFLVDVILFTVIYLFIIIKFVMNQYEKDLLIKPILKIFKY